MEPMAASDLLQELRPKVLIEHLALPWFLLLHLDFVFSLYQYLRLQLPVLSNCIMTIPMREFSHARW